MTANADTKKKQTPPLWLTVRGVALAFLGVLMFGSPNTAVALLAIVLGIAGVVIAATGVIRGAQQGWSWR